MTRSDLIAEMSAQFGSLTQNDAEYVVLAILDMMTSAFVHGQRIEIRGFGSFSLRSRASRVGRNPRNGDKVEVPPKRVLHFKPGKTMRLSVNDGVDTAVAEPSHFEG
ncbi:integration host factor subunit beta [Candidatus Symbiobacter mobilis]|uniref:Integration host factor subunit beta n=1 Tax=Candidatus Symbiobacter mobilis CR TaxID=946483 RepID=U5NA02_9BURK|nr:integration host factor subunit beta [Candidatus Symbiobacter mobilis]AGX87019.1 integration host factor subunit beta [Candidatus Symbiobacter mobilis CR]